MLTNLLNGLKNIWCRCPDSNGGPTDYEFARQRTGYTNGSNDLDCFSVAKSSSESKKQIALRSITCAIVLGAFFAADGAYAESKYYAIVEGVSSRFKNVDGNWGSTQSEFRDMGYGVVAEEHTQGFSLGVGQQYLHSRLEFRYTNFGKEFSAATYPFDQNSSGTQMHCPTTWPTGCPTQFAIHWGQAESVGFEYLPEITFDRLTLFGGSGLHYWWGKFSYCIGAQPSQTFDQCHEWKDNGLTLSFSAGVRWKYLVLSASYYPQIQVRGGDHNDKGNWNYVTTINAGLSVPF